MKIASLNFPENSQGWVASALPTVASSSVYKMACSIFRVLLMGILYADAYVSTTIHSWTWIRFSSAIPRKYLSVSCCNLANLQAMRTCFFTAWNPINQAMYAPIGRPQGLRVTHSIIYYPTGGLCLGMDLTFLAHYLKEEEGDDATRLLKAATVLQQGADPTSVKLQALYHALMGLQGTIDSQEKDFLCRLWRDKSVSLPSLHQKQDVVKSVEKFLSVRNRAETLRQFVFNDLENQQVTITPDLYALVLDVDASWNLQQHPHEKKYDSLHQAIMHAVADCLDLELKGWTRLQGKLSGVEKQLETLASGNYLVQFVNHTLVLIKTPSQLALLDPGEGMTLFSADQQSEILTSVLDYYGSHDEVTVKLIPIQQKAPLNHE